MGRFLVLNLPPVSRKKQQIILALGWFLGIFSGVICSASSGDSIAFLMRMASQSSASIIGLLSAMYLPLLLSFLAVYISGTYLLPVIASLKAFAFSYLSFGLIRAYGSAGWLVWMLMMFGDLCFLPFLLFCWIRFSSGDRRILLPVSLVATIAAVGIGSFDYCVVSPFLASLIS